MAATVLLQALLILLGSHLSLGSASEAWLWPASGFALAVLLRTPDLRHGLALGLGTLAGSLPVLWPLRPDVQGAAAGVLALALSSLAVTALTAALCRRLKDPFHDSDGGFGPAVRYGAALIGGALLLALVHTAVWQALELDRPKSSWPAQVRMGLQFWSAHAAGLLLVTPMLCVLLDRRRLPQGQGTLLFPMQCAGIGLTLMAATITGVIQRDAREAGFRGDARAIGMTLQNHVDMAVRDVERLRDFHYKVEISQGEFDMVADPMLARSPWLLHFGWLPRVPDWYRRAFEDSAAELDGQSIRELDPRGALTRALDRTEYYPLRWTTPTTGNEALIGIDEGFDPLRAPAIRQAVQLGGLVASSPYVSLARAATDASAVSLYAPVLAGEQHEGMAHDHAAVRGVVSGVLDLGRMVGHTLEQMATLQVDLLLFEGAGAQGTAGVQSSRSDDGRDLRVQAWLPTQDRGGPDRFTSDLHERMPVRLANREWTLLTRPTWLSEPPLPTWLQLGVLACGLGFTTLLGHLMMARQRHIRHLQAAHDGLEALVQQRTRALASTNERLLTEVEERRRLEDDLRSASQQAHHANQAKTMFLANMSHEIRTPLNAVIGYTQILLEDRALVGSTRERLRTILQAGQRLLRLINDVLDLSKIEAGGLQLHSELFDLRQEVDEIVQMFEQRSRGKGLGLVVDITLDTPSPVSGDRTKIGQIILNLMSNALKFTEQGHITLSARREDNEVLIEVGDTGPGIAPAELAQLFAPFRQGKSGLDKGGTGLGLVLARHMALAMGGELVLTSEVGRGTQVRLRLPLPVEHPDRFVMPTPEHPEQLSADTPVRALVVEDDAHSRDILVHLLERIGCQVEFAPDGLAGLRRAARGGLDIVFTDIRMPVLDGIQMLRQLRSQARDDQPGPPVVAVSASSLEHERRHYIQQGFSDFVGKPYAFEDIYRMLALHAGARFEVLADDTPAEPAGHAPAATVEARPGAVTLPLLTQLVEAAANGQLKRVRELLELLAQRPAPEAGSSTIDALPPPELERLQRAAQDYDFSALEHLAGELSSRAEEGTHPTPEATLP
ncbi:ATP-binding protein [Sphaerotilus hippei]|nr:ATP-binding protein [Sphaerotilus hippei]